MEVIEETEKLDRISICSQIELMKESVKKRF